MRAFVLWAVLLVAACDTAALGDAAEAAARGALERDGVTHVVLSRVGERTFDFTGSRGLERCEGTVVVNLGPQTSTAAIESRCE